MLTQLPKNLVLGHTKKDDAFDCTTINYPADWLLVGVTLLHNFLSNLWVSY